MALPTSREKVDPSLRDLLNLTKKEVALSINCVAVGMIQSFDASKQTAQVSIGYTKTIQQRDTETGVYKEVQQNYPLLADVPVIIAGGGDFVLTFPVASGDKCLVLFNDRDIDKWFTSGGQVGPVSSPRLHSLSDGIAIVGLRPAGESISSYDDDKASLRTKDGTVKVTVGDQKINMENAVTSIKDLLTQLNQTLVTLTTAMSAATPATVVATIAVPSAAALVTLNTVQTLIDGLFE